MLSLLVNVLLRRKLRVNNLKPPLAHLKVATVNSLDDVMPCLIRDLIALGIPRLRNGNVFINILSGSMPGAADLIRQRADNATRARNGFYKLRRRIMFVICQALPLR